MTSVTPAFIRRVLADRSPVRIVDPLAAEAAVALILVPTADDLEALFIRRAQVAGDPWSGHMALPGGRRHPADRDLLETAVRETREETGIALEPENHLGLLDDFTPRTVLLPRIVVQPHVFSLSERPEVTASDEVAGFVWVSLGLLRKSRTETDIEVRGSLMRLPAYSLGENLVWGLTERIISPFLELITQAA